MNKKIIFPAFIIMCLVQLYIPAKMILNKESVLAEGKEFRFKVAPIDPSDPFRGKYIVLSFEETTFRIDSSEEWEQGTPVFVNLREDEKGFAKIQSISREALADEENYVKAITGYVYTDTITSVTIHFPFDRFYMEESKAYNAEQAYNEAARDTAQITYALVSIKDGDAVVKDVLINGIPIRVAAMKRAENPE